MLWLVMFQAVKLYPQPFSTLNDVFKDILDLFVIVYLEDILIFSENPNNMSMTSEWCWSN